MIPFEKYAALSDRLCLLYRGPNPDYVVQISYVAPLAEAAYPEFRVEVCVRDDLAYLAPGAVPLSRHDPSRYFHVKEFKTNPAGEHPVWAFVKDAAVRFPATPIREAGSLCLVCPDAAHPSRPLSAAQVARLLNSIRGQGCQAVVLGSDVHKSYPSPDRVPVGADKLTYIDDARWVVGAENEYVFHAAAVGVRATLVPSGPGTALFRAMFPHGEVNGRI